MNLFFIKKNFHTNEIWKKNIFCWNIFCLENFWFSVIFSKVYLHSQKSSYLKKLFTNESIITYISIHFSWNFFFHYNKVRKKTCLIQSFLYFFFFLNFFKNNLHLFSKNLQLFKKIYNFFKKFTTFSKKLQLFQWILKKFTTFSTKNYNFFKKFTTFSKNLQLFQKTGLFFSRLEKALAYA